MNRDAKILRAMIREMPLPVAKEILKTNLPDKEYQAIYYCDCERMALFDVGDKILLCGESAVKKYRRRGYRKLSSFYFGKN
jgi:hypothetical protein